MVARKYGAGSETCERAFRYSSHDPRSRELDLIGSLPVRKSGHGEVLSYSWNGMRVYQRFYAGVERR